MAKDPAINWYFDNWAGGVKGFSRHQKGCYMDLLESQFYLGHLSLEQVKNILGADFNQWNVLKSKFAQDEQGNFFNERLELEKNKRMKYSESRAKNRSKKDMNNISSTHEKHMLNIPETEIGTETVFEDFGKPENLLHIGTPNGHRVTVKAKYLHERPKAIHDLKEYFSHMGQLSDIQRAGWLDFEGFMKANPGRVFEADSEVYHSFKKHCTKPKNDEQYNGTKKFSKATEQFSGDYSAKL